jgi:DNA polymerase III subunit delta
MKIRCRQLPSVLAKGLARVYTVHGAEALLVLEAADRIREAARAAGCTERDVFFAEPGADWSRLTAAASNLSLFATKRLMELRVPTGKPGVEGARAIEAWVGTLDSDTLGLVMLPELPAWLAERLGRQGQGASVETLEWLADRVEGNLLAAKQEVDKLALLLPQGEVSLAALREAVTDVSRFERDTLLEAIHGSDPARIARIVESLEAEGEPLPLLLWTLAEELRLMMAISRGERPRRFLPPERVEALGRSARGHDAASFGREVLRAHRIDRMIKGVEAGDPWDALLELAMGLAGRPVLADIAA